MYLGMPVHKDKSSLQQRGKVSSGHQLVIFADQGERLEAGLRGLRVEGCHVDQSTHRLPTPSAPAAS